MSVQVWLSERNLQFFSMGCAFVSVSLERTAGGLRTDCAYALVGIIIPADRQQKH